MIPSPPTPNDKNYHLEKHSVTPSKAKFEKKNYSLTSDNFFV